MEASAAPRPHRLAPSHRLLGLAGDDRLVALIRAGNERAFEVVYERYHRPLLSFSRHMLGNAEDAAEAVQHTFLSAYRDLVTSEKAIELKAWLYTIARNRCLSILRVRREHADVDLVEPATEGLAAEVQRREDLRELLGDVARLPEQQRAALLLAELGSLRHDEIGDVLGCTREKVKALVFQARSSLGASRQARATSCAAIREQLAVLRGGALRRTTLRRHLRECAGCRTFNEEVRRQREAFAVVLPVAPVAGLKATVLSGAGVAGGAAATTVGAGGGAAAVLAALGANSLAVKALVGVAILGGATAGGVVVAGVVGSGSHAAPSAQAAPAASKRTGGDIFSAASRGVASARPAAAAAHPFAAPGSSAGNSAGPRAETQHLGLTVGSGVGAAQPQGTGSSSPSTGEAQGPSGPSGTGAGQGNGRSGQPQRGPSGGHPGAPVQAPSPSGAPAPHFRPSPPEPRRPPAKGELERGNGKGDGNPGKG